MKHSIQVILTAGLLGLVSGAAYGDDAPVVGMEFLYGDHSGCIYKDASVPGKGSCLSWARNSDLVNKAIDQDVSQGNSCAANFKNQIVDQLATINSSKDSASPLGETLRSFKQVAPLAQLRVKAVYDNYSRSGWGNMSWFKAQLEVIKDGQVLLSIDLISARTQTDKEEKDRTKADWVSSSAKDCKANFMRGQDTVATAIETARKFIVDEDRQAVSEDEKARKQAESNRKKLEEVYKRRAEEEKYKMPIAADTTTVDKPAPAAASASPSGQVTSPLPVQRAPQPQ